VVEHTRWHYNVLKYVNQNIEPLFYLNLVEHLVIIIKVKRPTLMAKHKIIRLPFCLQNSEYLTQYLSTPSLHTYQKVSS